MLDKLLTFFTGNTIKEIGDAVDNLVTSDEERMKLKTEVKQILVNAEEAAQEQVSARWESDMKHGSFLSKNVRPLSLIFLTLMFVVISIFDGNIGEFQINDSYIPVYQTLLMTVYGAYFAGRSFEKIKKSE